jgi:hypothetical protein
MDSPEAIRNRSLRNWIIGLLTAFLLGLIPMGIVAYNRGDEVAAIRRELKAATLKNRIAAAALYGKRGEYEQARQAVSGVFEELRSRVEDPRETTAEVRSQLNKLLAERDDVITLLARSDPAGVERLFNLQYELRQLFPEPSA